MKYELTALTPFLVGDGQTLSPIDYMVWKDQINVLDQARIFKLLARGPRLEGYLSQLRKATKLDFASWGGFAQNFSQRRIPFEDAGSTALWNAAPAEAQFIPTFAANHRGPYVPGSAIKGALRTGLVFSRWNANTMEKIAAGLEADRTPRRLAEPAEVAAGVSQMRVISVVDSAATDTSTFRIYVSKIASLDTRQPGKPQLVWKIAGRGSVPPQRVNDATATFAEMAKPGTVFSGQWQERKYLENPELARALGWRSVPDPKTIFSAANDYAAAQLASHAKHAEMAGLSTLHRSVERLQGEVATAQGQGNVCILCLGWGGGFLSKTGFPNTDDESYRKILKHIPVFGRAVRGWLAFSKNKASGLRERPASRVARMGEAASKDLAHNFKRSALHGADLSAIRRERLVSRLRLMLTETADPINLSGSFWRKVRFSTEDRRETTRSSHIPHKTGRIGIMELIGEFSHA